MKNVTIFQLKGKGAYHCNFMLKGVRKLRSTGTSDERTAQRIANQMRNLALENLFEVPVLREEGPHCRDIVDRYVKKSAIKCKANVARDFLNLVGAVEKVSRKEALDIPLTKLTAEAMIAFRDQKDTGRHATSTNYIMRSARSIFAPRALEHYRDLKIPPCVRDWRSVAYLREPRNTGFQAIPQDVLAAMDGSADAMLRLAGWHEARYRRQDCLPFAYQWRNAWACYWLMRLCGLRNCEVIELRWSWFSSRPDGGMQIDIIDRGAEFKPKASSGSVPIDKGLYGLLVEQFGPPVNGNHVLLGTKNDRELGCLHKVNEFVRRFLGYDRVKGAYELRKQYGSEMAARYGIETAAKLLRHRDIKTAWRHYYDSLKLSAVVPLTMSPPTI